MNKNMAEEFFCAYCGVRNCAKKLGQEGDYPSSCPSLRPELEGYLEEYKDPETLKLAQAAAISSMDHTESRVQQTVRFARNCGFTKLGIAFCISLADTAGILARYLREQGFTVESVICKVGHYDRKCIGVEDTREIPMCNPIAQAEYLNGVGTELNLIVGLCVGHDALFSHYSHSPVVTLIAKDHAFHNAPELFLQQWAQKEKAAHRKKS